MIYLIAEDDISILCLTTRTENCLKRARIFTVGELMKHPRGEFLNIRNMGKMSAAEVEHVISEILSCTGRFIFDESKKSTISTNLLSDNKKVTSSAMVASKKKDKTIGFKSTEQVIGEEILIENLNLSTRAKNCLLRNGIMFFSDLINLSLEEMMEKKNIGKKTALEIMAFIEKHQVDLSLGEDIEAEKMLNAFAESFKDYFGGDKSVWFKELLIVKTQYAESINEQNILFYLYDSLYVKKTVKAFIVELLEKTTAPILKQNLFNAIPTNLINTIVFEAVLNELLEENLIEIVNEIITRKYPSVIDFVDAIPEIRRKEIISARLKGQTLQEIAEKNGITRERVRQLIAKTFRRHPVFREDKYAYIFQHYYISKEDFQFAFNESSETFNYLEMVYPIRAGNGDLLDYALGDLKIDSETRKKIEKAVYKNYIIVENSRIKRTRSALVEYYVKKYCKALTKYESFYEEYHLWLDSLGINDSSLYIESRTYENHLYMCDYVLWNQWKSFRYYSIKDYNYHELLSTLNLEGFENIELSTRKFFKEYSDLMYKYDIHDEYELHNLLKKIWPKDNEGVFFRKMPIIEIGVADRDRQVEELLFKYAPISGEQLAQKYEEVYGAKANTVLANFFGKIDIYYSNGIYRIDSKKSIV